MLGFGTNLLSYYVTNALIYQLNGVISSHARINMWVSKTNIHKNLPIHVVVIIKYIVGHRDHSQRHGLCQSEDVI
jgi:type III secretory pathway lipoprotein EscJ